jgi:hypothetical protein
VTVAPGATASVNYSVTSRAGTPAGAYGVWAAIVDAVNSAHDTTAVATYIVAADTVPPTAPSSLTASIVRKQVALAWHASTDNIGVTGYRVLRNGSVVTTTSGTAWTDLTVLSGAVYTVAAFDAAGNVSAPSNSATLKTTSTGKGK